MTKPVLVVGSGLLGKAIRQQFEQDGLATLFVSQSRSSEGLKPIDLSQPNGYSRLVETIQSTQPSLVVLAHGPARVGLCKENPDSAFAAHRSAAQACCDTDVPTLLISSDAVFPGSRPYGIFDSPKPMNEYGEAKLLAEEVLRHSRRSTIIRLSLLYDDAQDGLVSGGFLGDVLTSIANRVEFEAPIDQIVSPIYVGDVVDAIERMVREDFRTSPSLVHMSGPDQMSRYDLAVQAGSALGLDTGFIKPVTRAESVWSLRPPFSCLVPNTHEVEALRDWKARSTKHVFEEAHA